MKILKEGLGYDAKTKWWAGRALKCVHCQCEFELEVKDDIKVTSDQRDGDYASVNCPECGNVITVSNANYYQGRG